MPRHNICALLCTGLLMASPVLGQAATPESKELLVTPEQKAAPDASKKSAAETTAPEPRPKTPEQSATPEAKKPPNPSAALTPPAPVKSGVAHDVAAPSGEGLRLPQPTVQPAPAGTVQTSSLGLLTQLNADLEVAKLRVAIAEQESRLRQFNAPAAAPQPAMPSLDKLLEMPVKPAAVKSSSRASSRRSGGGTRVISIQGANGALSATVSTGSGTLTVRPGDSVAGGKVASITYNQVLVRYGNKKTASLPFME